MFKMNIKVHVHELTVEEYNIVLWADRHPSSLIATCWSEPLKVPGTCIFIVQFSDPISSNEIYDLVKEFRTAIAVDIAAALEATGS